MLFCKGNISENCEFVKQKLRIARYGIDTLDYELAKLRIAKATNFEVVLYYTSSVSICISYSYTSTVFDLVVFMMSSERKYTYYIRAHILLNALMLTLYLYLVPMNGGFKQKISGNCFAICHIIWAPCLKGGGTVANGTQKTWTFYWTLFLKQYSYLKDGARETDQSDGKNIRASPTPLDYYPKIEY